MILAFQPGYAAYASLASISRSSFAHSISYAPAGDFVGGLKIPPAFPSSESSSTASRTPRETRRSAGLGMQQQLLGRACGLGTAVASAGVLIPRLFPQVQVLALQSLAPTRSYWLTRSVFLRALGAIFSVAFSVALVQNKALIGDKGVTPARQYLRRVVRNAFDGDVRRAAKRIPTLFWLLRREAPLDPWLDRTAILGLVLSLVVMVLGAANVPIMLSLWILYHTLVNVGQHWYGFGWESQLLETAFLAIFTVPLFSLRAFTPAFPPSPIIPWLYRWLAFRIMLGAGLIKIRGDKVWRDFTATCFHYETQPLPNPISYYLHQMPKAVHRFETAMNHLVELGGTWLLLAPFRALSMFGGGLQMCFQLAIIVSGNLSFLNYLTILPFIWCFDDRALAWMFSERALRSASAAASLGKSMSISQSFSSWFLLGLVLWLSAPVMLNMASKKQAMNRTYEPLRIVNTYGAFGSISKVRPEIVISAAAEFEGGATAWEEYEVSSLLKTNPFLLRQPPKWIKADMYRYSFTKAGSEESKRGQVWQRELLGSYWAATNMDGLRQAIAS